MILFFDHHPIWFAFQFKFSFHFSEINYWISPGRFIYFRIDKQIIIKMKKKTSNSKFLLPIPFKQSFWLYPDWFTIIMSHNFWLPHRLTKKNLSISDKCLSSTLGKRWKFWIFFNSSFFKRHTTHTRTTILSFLCHNLCIREHLITVK